MSLTGNKDTDYIILSNLDDRSLFSYCQTDKYAKKLCEDENFWKNRFISNFGSRYLDLKSKDKTWKKFYLQIVSIMNLENPDDMQDFDEDEYINFYKETLKTSLGEWDVFNFFEKYLPHRYSPIFLKLGIGEEILKNFKINDISAELLRNNVSSFPILKKILYDSNPEFIKKVKESIKNDENLTSIELGYLYYPEVREFIMYAENY